MMMSAQLVSIIVMFISGIFVGAIIDGTRTVLQMVPIAFIRRITVFLEWLIWLFLGVCTFYFLFLIKGGQWRVVDPLAQIAGIVTYEFIFQNFFRFTGRIMVNILIRPFYKIGHLFVRFIRSIVRIIVSFIVLLNRPLLKFFKKFL